MIGQTIGPYRVLARLGAGGMGEVYRATDTKLGRDVAIKVLPPAVAQDPERLARFDREARTLASLNHPNVAAVYGLEAGPRETGQQTPALVMELVDGPTLADRLAQDAIPVAEALPIARQIAEALEAAHAHGIVHRDLKPANVKVRPDGTVKVLDFGLAKAMDPAGAATGTAAASEVATITAPAMTGAGVVLGTPAYMSPEQVRGGEVDHRADIWAFGVVLYEMLTGCRLFDGATVSDTLAEVLRTEPDWRALPADTPAAIRRLLRRCLARDRRQRLQHVGDARLEIDDPAASDVTTVATGAVARWTPLAAGAVLVALAVALFLSRPPATASGDVVRFMIPSLTAEHINVNAPLALSPDGRLLVYGIGGTPDDSTGARLILHDLATGAGRLLSEEGGAPFFSLDGGMVGFTRESGGFRQVAVAGSGAPVTLVDDARSGVGASWGSGGVLVSAFGWGLPLFVQEDIRSGPRALTQVRQADSEDSHLWPQVLPGERHVLFSMWTSAPSWDEARIAVADLATGEHRVVVDGGAFGRYVPSGHLLFWRGNALMAAPFDLDSASVTGSSRAVVEGVRLSGHNGAAHYAVSDTGTLAYVPGGLDLFVETLVVDRSGRELLRLDDVPVGQPSFSPDGRQVALTLYGAGNYHVGVYDLEREVLTRLATARDNLQPSWTADGSRITYLSSADGDFNHYVIAADGSGGSEPLLPEGHGACCSNRAAWSPGNQHVVVAVPVENRSDWDLWMRPGSAGSPFEPLVEDPGNQRMPAISPDGRFIVYESTESGVTEIWLRPFPDVSRGKRQVSQAGGTMPVWSRGGAEILYATPAGLMSVDVRGDGAGTLPSLTRPQLVLDLRGIGSFDATSDGARFVISRFPVESAPSAINVVLNWFTELERLVPTR